ncbi:hypothetical protein [Streptomyces sp. NPDC006784]
MGMTPEQLAEYERSQEAARKAAEEAERLAREAEKRANEGS